MSDLNYYGNFMTVPLRQRLATLLHRLQLEPVPGRRFCLLSRRRLHVRVRLSLGMDALQLRRLGLRSRLRMGLAARQLEYLERAANGGECARKMIVPPAPATGRKTVMVGLGLAANPAGEASRRLTINPNSAGFGVPAAPSTTSIAWPRPWSALRVPS